MSAESADAPVSSRFDNEEFLFHLYRGSELLQDNCVGEAKEELERALSLQPRDAEGQALLGVVYFRLGLYPRAIQIYEELIWHVPTEATPRVNLALCYLKTGQLLRAREVLEEVIALSPQHRRAWGYLGLVFERLGELSKAEAAFEQAGQPQMAERVRRLGRAPSDRPAESQPPAREELRQFARDAEHQLDQDKSFARAESAPEGAPSRSGLWKALELGATTLLQRSPPPPPPAIDLVSAVAEGAPLAPPPASGALPPLGPRRLSDFVEQLELARAGAHVAAQRSSKLDAQGGFSVRLDAVLAISGTAPRADAERLPRRFRGQPLAEPLGGADAAFVHIESADTLLLGGIHGGLLPVELDGERLFLREHCLIGFAATVQYENGRLPSDWGDPIPLVQLFGTGRVILRHATELSVVRVDEGTTCVARPEAVFGWTGRLLPQPVSAAQAPGGARGFVSFSGRGALLLCVDSRPS